MTDSQIPFQNIRQLLAEKGEYVSLVSGVSMYPMLRFKKDPVLIHPINRELNKYDVVLYSKGDLYVIHRILEVCDDQSSVAIIVSAKKEYRKKILSD